MPSVTTTHLAKIALLMRMDARGIQIARHVHTLVPFALALVVSIILRNALLLRQLAITRVAALVPQCLAVCGTTTLATTHLPVAQVLAVL